MKDTGERCILGKSGSQIEKEHVDRYLFSLKFLKNKKLVLDIACGSGYGTKLLAKNDQNFVYGVDILKEAVKYAIKNNYLKNIKYLTGSALNLSMFKNNYFDAIVSFETIEHLPDYKTFLNEIIRVLKKN